MKSVFLFFFFFFIIITHYVLSSWADDETLAFPVLAQQDMKQQSSWTYWVSLSTSVRNFMGLSAELSLLIM